MAPYESDDSTNADEVQDVRSGRRRAARYVVPVTVVGVAAATIGLVPAFAGSGDPGLPEISAQELIERVAASDTERLSGTVKVSTDLGLPDLGGLESAFTSGAARGGDGSAADPASKLTELASGTHTLRVAVDGPDRAKVSLLDNASEYSLIHNGDEVWAYDSRSNEAYHMAAPETSGSAGKRAQEPRGAEDFGATPKELTAQALKAVDGTTSVTVDGTVRVADRDAYKLLIKPRQSGSTVGAISIAVDARTGTPLKFTLSPSGGGAAVVDAGFTEVDFAAPAASTFDFSPPKGAKVTEGDELKEAGEAGKAAPKADEHLGKELGAGLGQELDGLTVLGEGWSSVARFETGGSGMPASGEVSGDAGRFLDSLGEQVKGSFGSGTVFSTRLVNALVTDDGTVYAGTVTKETLLKAANAGR